MRLRLLAGPSVLAIGLVAAPSLLSRPQAQPPRPDLPAAAPASSRQVTVFGIRANPGEAAVDPALRGVAPQLRKLMPGHAFRLIGTENERLQTGSELTCPAGQGRILTVRLLERLDEGGKVRLQVRLLPAGGGEPLFDRVVATPPDQLVFLDKELSGERLLVGLGAR